MRQGLLSEPEASSGPAAMLLAVSRSPSSIPRRSPCLERCHLPLAFLYTSTSQNLKNIPDCIHSRSDATFLWRSSTTSTSQNLKNIPACIHPRSDVTFLWRPSPSQQKKRHPAVPTLPDTGTKTPVKQTYTIYNQHSLSAQLNYHQKVLSATQDRWPAL